MSRIAVFAYSDTGHACLKFLLERGEDVALVVTHADDPGEPRWFDSVAELARSRGIEPMILEDPRDPAAIARVKAAQSELLFSFYYRGILPAEILERRLEQLKGGTAPRRPQKEEAATTFPKRRPEDGRIEWNRTAEEVHNLVRAVTHPYPGAFTDIFGGRTFLWKTKLPHLGAHDNFPGQVRAEQGRLYVACGDDRYVEVLRIQREGQNEIDARHFLSEAVSP